MFGFDGAKLKGIWGNGDTTVLTVGANDLKPTPIIIFNSGSNISFSGMQKPSGNGVSIVRVFNIGAGIVSLAVSGSKAGNGFSFPSNFGQLLKQFYGCSFWYDFISQVWHFCEQPFITGTGVITVTSGIVSISQAATASSGFLSATDWNTFNNKVGGSGNTGRVAFWLTSNSLTNDAGFVYDSVTDRLGVQTPTPLAVGHFTSATQEQPSGPNSLGASLTHFTFLATPGGASATQVPGRLMNPDSPTATENFSGSSPWLTGDTLDYLIIPYYFDGMDYFYGAVAAQPSQTVLTADNSGVDLTWSPDNSGSIAISGYHIYRSYNSGGFNDWYDVGNVASYTDNGLDPFNSGTFPAYPQYDDYIATGVVRSYEAYSKDTIAPGDVYSASSFSYGMTDDGSGKPYQVDHSVSPDGSTARVLGESDGSGTATHIDGVLFTENSGSWQAGNDVTPNTYGYFADGTQLNRNYELHKINIISGVTCYSSASITAGVSDPGDSEYYYVTLTPNWGGASTGAKLLRDTDGDFNYDDSHIFSSGTSDTYYDTGTGGWPFSDNTVITPTGVVPAGFIIEKDGSSSDAAHLIIKGLSDYSRIEFTEASNVVRGTIQADSNGIKYGISTSEKLAFHGSTPVIQRTGAAQAAVATTAATNVVPYGYTTQAQADAIVTLVNEIRAALVQIGIIKGSA